MCLSNLLVNIQVQNCDLPQSTLIIANAVTKLLQWGNFQEQKNSHPFPLPSIQSWGICCFVQVT